MRNTISLGHFSRSYKLLFLNAFITIPLIAALFINQAAQVIFHPSMPDGTLFGRICASFISILAFSFAYTCMVGMTQAAVRQGTAAFQDGIQAVFESIDRIVFVTIILITCSTIYTISSTLLKQYLTNQDSISSTMTSFAMLPLVFTTSFALSFFLLYTGPSIIIGRKSLLSGLVESAKIVLQTSRTSLTIAILFYGLIAIGSFFLSDNFFTSHIFQFFLFLLLFAPFACFTNFLICAEYVMARRFPTSSAEKSRGKYAVIFGALFYIVAFSSLSAFLPASEIVAKTASLSTYFQPKIDTISLTNDLQTFITETRSIKLNRMIERSDINDAYGMIVPQSEAYKYLEAWFPAHNPFTLAHSKIKFIYAIRVHQDPAGNAYDITWNEAVANPTTHAIKSSEHWEAKIHVVSGPTHKKAFITHLSWQKK
jgi:type IV secretory pathway TrbF-like protein